MPDGQQSPSLSPNSRKKLLNIKKGETHKEKFEDDAERWKEARGYLIIFSCNALSCWALGMYVFGLIDSRRELYYEGVFLVTKGIVEMLTGKFGWELLLHHTAMIGGLWLNQHRTMHCLAFITVHQQFVHVPFALRALWRLTLPALGFVPNELSWRRRGLINLFWMTWMFNCGYRSAYILWYVLFVWSFGWYWQGGVGLLMAVVLASLDRGWTKAMWPKPGAGPPNPNPLHEWWFHVGTRAIFVFGLVYSLVAFLSDAAPAYLPVALRVPFASYFSVPLRECLVNEGHL